MWETPFDPSMLNNSGVVIHCPDESDASILMGILAEHGVKWCDGTSPASDEDSCWDVVNGNTVYYIDQKKSMTWGSKSDSFPFSDGYIKCTFYGAEQTNFEVASDDELLSLFGIGGV